MRTVEGYKNKQVEYWRMTRRVLCLLYNINVPQKDQQTPEEYMPLMGDPGLDPAKSAAPTAGGIPPHIFIQMITGIDPTAHGNA